MAVFAGMLVATILGVLLIPMLFVTVERLIGGGAHAPAPAVAPPLAPQHGSGGH